MKKIVAVTIFLALLTSPAFGATFKAETTDAGKTLQATAPVNTLIGKTSKGVRLAATYEITAFAMITMHTNGTKYYGTAYDSTAIMVQSPAGDINASFAAPDTSVGDTAFTTADKWSAL
jgi:hypothetical protein